MIKLILALAKRVFGPAPEMSEQETKALEQAIQQIRIVGRSGVTRHG